jgi:hypothetical protein
MKIKLSKIKTGKSYKFNVYYNLGCGSGSQGWYNIIGEVKEINAEFIRVIPTKNIEAGNKKSIKVSNRSITEVHSY